MFQEIVYILSGLGILFYVFMTWNFDYWKKRNIPGPAPRFLMGNLPSVITNKQSLVYDLDDLYKEYKDRYNFIGFLNVKSPNILLTDPQQIKDVLIKNFKFFADNTFATFTNKEADPIFGRNPFMLKGAEWKEKRQEITPAFTVSRIKTVYPIVEDVCDVMKEFIIRENKKHPNGIDAKELSAKFTTDVVSNCIFGLDAGSFTKEKPIIREMGKELFTPSLRVIIWFFVITIFPAITKIYNLPFVPKNVEKFFVSVMKDAVAFRRKSNVNRNDFLHYLLELKEKKNLTDLDMVAHAVTFFIDGFETSSVAMSFVLFELGRHKNVQEKLRNEIKENIAKHGKLTHDVVSEMPYLDQVIMEALRLYPPAGTLAKTVTEQTELKVSEGEYRTIEKGMEVWLPIYSLHRDPEYFNQPNDFIPERFDSEHGGSKAFRDKGVFLPFGDGPRICLGQRFAQTQIKAAIVSIVNNFEIKTNSKTQVPIVFDPKQFLLYPIGGLWVDFKEL